MLRIIALLLFTSLIIRCGEPPVVFEESQPKDLAPKAFFEPIYRGVFQCESDSSLVHVTAKTIYKEKAYKFKASLAEIDSMEVAELVDSQLWVKGFEEPIPIMIEGDSASGEIMLRDTLFNISENHILKHFRGHHILNKKLAANKWEVLILSIDYDLDLRLSEAVMPEDLEALKKITPVKDISTEEKDQILLSPTPSEFREILKRNLVFQECDIYRRFKFPKEI
ncbi:MAG: hypothetical protein R2788_18110 [Saprospiraceae bacterium]